MKCARCGREIAREGNWVRLHLFGAFAVFHVRCFAPYLHDGASDELERVTWQADRALNLSSPAPTRGKKYQGEPE